MATWNGLKYSTILNKLLPYSCIAFFQVLAGDNLKYVPKFKKWTKSSVFRKRSEFECLTVFYSAAVTWPKEQSTGHDVCASQVCLRSLSINLLILKFLHKSTLPNCKETCFICIIDIIYFLYLLWPNRSNQNRHEFYSVSEIFY